VLLLIEKGGDTMLKKKQVLTMISIAVMSFILGTTFNENLMALGSKEYGISGVDFEEFINETSRVELIRTEPIFGRPEDKEGKEEIIGYQYVYGVSGIWNISKIQTEPIIDKLSTLLSGLESIWVGVFFSSPFENQGYERGITVYVYGDRELSEAEIETIRLLIEEYLAKP